LSEVLPARGQLTATRHHPAVPFAELPDFMTALQQQPGVRARALEFTILTACRTSEVVDAVWSEIDLDARLFTIPAARMKMSRDHRIPLSDRALAMLQQLPRHNDWVFGGIGSGAMSAVLKRLRPGVTVHGFRSTFRDWVSECTNYPGAVAEAALAHAIDNKVEAAYRRGDLLEKRAKLMQAYTRYCYTDATVVPLRRAVR
jgi:integrase